MTHFWQIAKKLVLAVFWDRVKKLFNLFRRMQPQDDQTSQ